MLEILSDQPLVTAMGEVQWVKDFPSLAERMLEWMPEDLVGAPGQEVLPETLEVVLPDYSETLKPTYAVRNPNGDDWLLLVQEVKTVQKVWYSSTV